MALLSRRSTPRNPFFSTIFFIDERKEKWIRGGSPCSLQPVARITEEKVAGRNRPPGIVAKVMLKEVLWGAGTSRVVMFRPRARKAGSSFDQNARLDQAEGPHLPPPCGAHCAGLGPTRLPPTPPPSPWTFLCHRRQYSFNWWLVSSVDGILRTSRASAHTCKLS